MAAKDKYKIADHAVFALDIGTRSIIGIVGVVEDDRFKVIAIEREEHSKRAMIDGQIEDINQVSKLAAIVKKRLEDKIGFTLTRVCIAAAGRALITQNGSYELQLEEARKIDPEIICRLESGAISQAEQAFNSTEEYDPDRQFFLVGYSVLSYCLDGYTISTLIDHKGKNLRADVIATFLPSEVVESLYTTMNKINLEVASLTLEPIAAINASIPQELRLLNLVLVDIGAGTSDIAACRDGGIIGYTMATLAGDEITETLMKQYLIDFKTAEEIKFSLSDQEDIVFNDILGFEQKVQKEEVISCIQKPLKALSSELTKRITELNNGTPSAVFLAGGGSKLVGLREALVRDLGMDGKRVAIAGNNFQLTAFSEEYDLNNPEYATPLGIAVSAGLNLINDSFRVTLNGRQAKLFKNGVLTIMDVLMMNGYGYQHLVGRSGKKIVIQLNGNRKVIYGTPSIPSVLKLNGKECKVTDIIHAGDIIDFQPAVHGDDAKATLADILEPEDRPVYQNGIEASPNSPLRTGDVVETKHSPPPIIEDIPEEDLSVKQVLEENSIPAARVEPPLPASIPPVSIPPASIPSASAPSVNMPTAAAAVADSPEPLSKDFLISLNDAPLSLPPKADGEPYYLMDILAYSGLDFNNLSGNVVITINGQSGTFLQKLQQGDVVAIRTDKT